MKTINLIPGDPYYREHYGIVLVSETEHDVVGKGVHNRNFPHQIDVWENRNGKDPHGNPTDEPYSYLLKARAVVISAHPGKQTPRGDVLELGEEVRLAIHGYVIGTFRIEARPFHDPHLARVD